MSAQTFATASREALFKGDVVGVIAALEAGFRAGASVAALGGGLAASIAAAEGPWRRAVVVLSDAVRVAGAAPEKRALLPLAQAASIMAETLRWTSAEANESATPAELIDALYSRGAEAGHHAPVVAAIAELAEACGDDAVGGLCARAIAAVNEPGLDDPALAAHCEREQLVDGNWETIFSAADPAKLAKFQEPKFRKHLVEGQPEAAFRATARAAAFGIPRAVLAGSIGLAAAQRLLQFDAHIAADPRRQEDFTDPIFALETAAAITRLLRHADRPEWLRLLLYGAWLVNRLKVVDATFEPFAMAEPEPLPQTWDHGPEIAKVGARMLASNTDGAIAALRGYLLMMLPVQPLCAHLSEAAFDDHPQTATGQALVSSCLCAAVEVFSSLGDNPHREIVLGSALRAATRPLAPRSGHRQALLALDAMDGLAGPFAALIRRWTS